ncbi:MAG: hypothetical protein ACRC0S_03955 [Fusobacteriaceae bacterium]
MKKNIWVIRMDLNVDTHFNGKDIYTLFGSCINCSSDELYIELKEKINDTSLSIREIREKIMTLKTKYSIKENGNCVRVLIDWSKNMKIEDYIFIYHNEDGINKISLAEISGKVEFFTLEKIFAEIDIKPIKIELMKRTITNLRDIPSELADIIRKKYYRNTLVKVQSSKDEFMGYIERL